MSRYQNKPEAAWQTTVYGLARAYGWSLTYHTHNSEKSERGWLDLVLAKPSVERVLFVELKAEGKYPTPAQKRWVHALYVAGLEVDVWWPKDLDKVKRALGPAQEPLTPPARYRQEPPPELPKGYRRPSRTRTLTPTPNRQTPARRTP